jgi:hypothetical protein
VSSCNLPISFATGFRETLENSSPKIFSKISERFEAI